MNANLEPSAYKKFLNLGNIFKKRLNEETTTLSQDKIDEKLKQINTQLKEELVNTVNEVISEKNEQKLLILLNKGYQVNLEQAYCIALSDFKNADIKEFILEHYDIKLKNDLNKFLMNINNRPYVTPENSHLYNRRNNSFALKEMFSEMGIKIDALWKYVGQNNFLTDSDYVLTFLSACKEAKKTLNHFNVLSPTDIFHKNLDNYIAKIEHDNKDYILQKFEKDLDKYSFILDESSKLKKTMAEDVLANIKKFNEKDLPENCQTLIKQIREINSDINPESLNLDSSLVFNNLYKKRLPQVLEEYISISPRYKDKLKKHNENPDTLLEESLTEIKEKMNILFETVQEKNHTKMLVTNRYLKKV